jgi:hypothetical protein
LARALIVGCGCRGRELGRGLAEAGLAVRGTTRSESGLGAIETAGIEAAVADPDRPGTILDLVGDVALVVWLLGPVLGEVHGERLESLLAKLVDTPVRGFAYEGTGEGAEIVERAAETWRIPVAIIRGEPSAGEILALLG